MSSASDCRVVVESCVRKGLKFEWNLQLTGFNKGNYIYIYHATKGQITKGHCIENPAAAVVVSSWNADLFDLSKRDEYRFRVFTSWLPRSPEVACCIFPVVFPPDEVKVFADAKIAADKVIADAAVAQAKKAEAEVKAKDPQCSTLQSMSSASDYRVVVESCVRNGLKFEWNLQLTGFNKGNYIYIYHATKGQITKGHCIENPAAAVVVSSWNADLFDLSKCEEYRFRVFTSWLPRSPEVACCIFPVVFPPDEVKVFADAKIAADKVIADAAVAQAKKAEAEVKAKEAANKAKAEAEARALFAAAEVIAKEAAVAAKAKAEVEAKEAAANKAKAEAANKAKAEAEFKAAVLKAEAEERPLMISATKLQIAATAAAQQKHAILEKLSKSRFESKSFDEVQRSENKYHRPISDLRKELKEVEKKQEAAQLELSSAPSRRAAAKEKFEAATHMWNKSEEPLRKARVVHELATLAAKKVNEAADEAVRFKLRLGIAATCIVLFLFIIAVVLVYVYRVAPSEFLSPYVSAPLILLCTCSFWGLRSANSSQFKENISAKSNAVRRAEYEMKELEKENALENKRYCEHRKLFDAVEASCRATQDVLDECAAKHQSLSAKISQVTELERKHDEGMAESERLFNESIAQKRQQAVLDAEAADARAAAAYQVALNAFIARIPVAQLEDEVSRGKSPRRDEEIRDVFYKLMATRIQEEEEFLARQEKKRIQEEEARQEKKRIQGEKDAQPGFLGLVFGLVGAVAAANKNATPGSPEVKHKQPYQGHTGAFAQFNPKWYDR